MAEVDVEIDVEVPVVTEVEVVDVEVVTLVFAEAGGEPLISFARSPFRDLGGEDFEYSSLSSLLVATSA